MEASLAVIPPHRRSYSRFVGLEESFSPVIKIWITSRFFPKRLATDIQCERETISMVVGEPVATATMRSRQIQDRLAWLARYFRD